MKDLIKKWWFWIIMLIALIVIGITIIMVVALNIATGDINEVALEVQRIDDKATVYTSAGGNTIVIELSNDSKEIREQVEKKIQNYATSGGILSNYSNLVIYIPLEIDGKSFLVKNVYILPTLEQDASKERIYTDYVVSTIETSNNRNSTMTIESEDKGEDITLTAGKYTVGTDIKSGKYDVIAQAGSGNFWVSGSTDVVEVLSAEAERKERYGYIDKYVNLILKDGDTIELRSNLKVLLQAK